MYSGSLNKIGEHTSVAEELLSEVPEIEQKCRAVEKAVKKGYFTLQEALLNYKVSEAEYIPYDLLRNNKKIKRIKKQDQVFDIIAKTVSIFELDSRTFSPEHKQAMKEIRKILDDVSLNRKLLTK